MEEEKETIEVQEETVKVETPEEPSPCVRCGWSAGKKPEPLEKDMEEYLRCVLGGKEFRKQYEMHDGAVKYTYRALTNRQADKLNSVLFPVVDREQTPQLQDQSIKLKILYFLSDVSLDGKEESYEAPVEITMDGVSEEFDARYGDCPEMLVRLMAQTLTLFSELQSMLVGQGFDENFWKGAGLR